ncbi:FISUMP domain-containing protein [Fibrobacter sp.]|uniref:FISUMP domain-containing protein n=1 Tax=Fibrobacter sp. TaxID=35828 RepID=UPI0025BB8729|nr:FISUMP domain-containing protein [Fibrobacter sp.]
MKNLSWNSSLRLSFWSRPLRLSSWRGVASIGSIAFLLAACGDEVTTQVIQDNNMSIVSTTQELPKCTKDNEGEQAFVKGETAPRVCMDGKWFATSSGGKDTVLVKDTVVMKDTIVVKDSVVIEKNSTCTTKELKDKSGVKIICGGDSVGVVLNGQNGANGKDGSNGKDGAGCSVANKTDSTVTIACGTDKFTIPLGNSTKPDTGDVEYEIENGSISGVSQKGPFVKGSSVTAVELDGSKSLLQTGRSFVSVITQDDGCFNMRNVTLKSSYVRLSVNGYYRNEVTGKNSTLPITLNAVTDLDARNTVNVNLLTHLEYERVAYLMAHGDGTLKIKKLKKQAEGEIFKAFYCDDLADFGYSEDLNVFGKTDADAALLAISILLQGDRDEADLVVLLTEISNAFAEKGTWTDSMTKVILADWALKADSENRLALFRKNVAGWRLGDTVPGFEKFVRNYVNVVSGLGTCGDKNNPVGTSAHVPNKNSSYYAKAYDSIDAAKNSLARFVCDSKGGNHWRRMTALERDTLGWSSGKTGEMRPGRIDTSLIYVYDGGWRHGTDLDIRLKKACVKSSVNEVQSLVQGKDTLLYKCTDGLDLSYDGSTWTLAWAPAGDNEFEKFFFETHRDSLGAFIKGPITGKVMVWDADTLREPTQKEMPLGRSCVTEMRGKKYNVPIGLIYECTNSGWSKTGVFFNGEDEYKATVIGDQIWMAENLRTQFTEVYYSRDIIISDDYMCAARSFFSDSLECYYSWAMAVDSAAIFSDGGKGCGYGKLCGNRGRIRGICPEGWHLPSREEWVTLLATAGGVSDAPSHLKAVTGSSLSNGIDTYGFALEYYGAWDSHMGGKDAGIYGNAALWCSDDESSNYAYYIGFTDNDVRIIENSKQYTLMNVRCVKD